MGDYTCVTKIEVQRVSEKPRKSRPHAVHGTGSGRGNPQRNRHEYSQNCAPGDWQSAHHERNDEARTRRWVRRTGNRPSRRADRWTAFVLWTGWSASWLHIEIRKPSPSPEISIRKSRHSCESVPLDGRRIVSWRREPTMPMIDFYAAARTFLLLGELSANRKLSGVARRY